MRSRAPLSLMEQMVMLAVFAVAAAVCLRVFVQSDQLSRESEARDRAALVCQNAAEVIRRTGRPAEAGGRYYDENWAPASEAEGRYRLEVRALESGQPGLCQAAVSVCERDGRTLFELNIAWQEEVSGVG